MGKVVLSYLFCSSVDPERHIKIPSLLLFLRINTFIAWRIVSGFVDWVTQSLVGVDHAVQLRVQIVSADCVKSCYFVVIETVRRTRETNTNLNH